MFKWKRENLDGHPILYLHFKAKDNTGDDLIEYRIQDLPDDRIDDAVEFLTGDHYLREETFTKGLEIKDDPEALQENRDFYKILFGEKTSLVCFKNGSDEIIALNALLVVDTTVHEFNFPVKSERNQRLLAATGYVKSKCKSEPKDVQFVLEGKGMCVAKDYRRRGIGTKLLEARIPFMKVIGLTTTVTLFTGTGSQKSAQRAGYDEYCEVTYEDVINQGHDIRHLTETSAKIYGYQIKE